MLSKHLPTAISGYLTKEFGFPDKIWIGQVASVDAKGQAWQRTLRIYGIEESLGLIFLTHVGSQKWCHLQENPRISVCALQLERRVQLLVHCSCRLLTHEQDPKLFEKYWSLVREDVKLVYNPQAKLDGTDDSALKLPDGPTSRFGMIAAQPYFWESLKLGDQYIQSIRIQYELTNGSSWVEQRTPLGYSEYHV
jgi:Pyridoxamine 5'-phosphate oxidase